MCAFMLCSLPALLSAQPPADCDRYANNAGGGDGLTPGTPYQVTNFWGDVVPGTVDELCLLDDEYTGANSMITPTASLAGTAANPITIRCLNEGQCRINGQGARIPVNLDPGHAWYRFIGLNAHNSDDDLFELSGVANIEIYRSGAWDGNPGIVNGNGFSYSDADQILCEDCFVFGTMRVGFGGLRSTNITLRRVFCRQEGITLTNDLVCIQLARGQEDAHTVDNAIAMRWHAPGAATPNASFLLNTSTESDAANLVTNHVVNGVILYRQNTTGVLNFTAAHRNRGGQNLAFSNIATSIGSDFTGTESHLFLNTTPAALNVTLDSYTTHNDNSNVFHGQYTPTDGDTCGSDGVGCQSIYDNPAGAEICKRYVDRVLTNDPLFPWPMTQRIVDAMTFDDNTRVTDVDADVQAIFGTYPIACTTAAVSSTSRLNNAILRNGNLR